LNSQAALILRANTLKANLEQVKKSLEEEGFGSEESKLSSLGLVMKDRKNVFGTKTFKSGFFEVQDEGSQKIAPFLEVKPGQRVVDACAGAGGKTLHLAALMENKGMLVALDNHPKKLEQLKLRARRAGVSNLRSQLVDSSKVVKRLEGSFDRVLLDVPCSGTGVLRRNPDSKWKLSPEEVERLVKLQAQILEDYSKMCKPGGKLVYATCSLLSRENEEQIDLFLEKHPGLWKRDTADLRLSPQSGGCDGFFAARLLRI
jgi:16S rRNA (cytosine967-C5)-methyltransferase